MRILLLLLLLAGLCSGQSSDCSYQSLLDHLNLTSGVDLSVMRPVRNWTTPTIAQLDLLIYGILQVDEKFQTVTSHIWLQTMWTNEFLMWDPSDFCGIRHLSIPVTKLWRPDISIQEDASDTGSVQRSSLATVAHQGWVLTTSRQRLTSTCQLKLGLFPFDKQVCNFTFGSMVTDGDSIALGTLNNDSTLTMFSERVMITQGEWQLTEISTINYVVNKTGYLENKLIYRFTIQRRPMLYVINLIVPLFYLLVLDLTSFFINEARGEKLGFKVTVLLSISVLLLILQDMLPSTEDQLPMIASYCVAVFALVGLSVLEAMMVSYLSDLDAAWEAYRNRKAADQSRKAADEPVEIQLDDVCLPAPPAGGLQGQEPPEKRPPPPEEPSSRDLVLLLLQEVKAARQEITRQGHKTYGYYKRVAEIVDTVYFFLYFLTVVVFLVYMYTNWIVYVFQ